MLTQPAEPSPVESSTHIGSRIHGQSSSNDAVFELRQVGTNRRYALSAQENVLHEEGLLLGSSTACHLRIEDPAKRVSRKHARVFYKGGGWHVLDLGSKNGLYVDGVLQCAAQLQAGMTLRVGGVTLVAESRRSLDLRNTLGRFLGWGWNGDAEASIDAAMQTLRNSQLSREPIWLHSRGEGDLSPVARELHRYMTSDAAPFVMCDPRRQSGESGTRSPANHVDLRAAISAAEGGTLCVRQQRPPGGLASFVQLLRNPNAHNRPNVQVMILCEDVELSIAHMTQRAISIPALKSRDPDQIAHVVREYFLEAEAALGAKAVALPSDHAWVLKESASSFGEVMKATRRITAVRVAGNVLGAAELLDMAPVSLRRWLTRRGMTYGRLVLHDENLGAE